MPDFSRPVTYVEKLRFAERVVKAAQFRHDQKQAVRELCEAMTELISALLEREPGGATQAEAGQPGGKPTPLRRTVGSGSIYRADPMNRATTSEPAAGLP
jgi:hypothetical protein